jgi:hypothetical protein
LNHESGPLSARRIDRQHSSNRIQPFPHANQSQASALAIRLQCAYIKTHPIVFDTAAEYPLFLPDPNPYVPRFRMLRRVGQRLLNDAVKGYFYGTRQSARNCRLDLNREIGAF